MKSLLPRFKPNYDFKEFMAAICFWRNEISIYENEFSNKFGCKYGTMFSYGRSGLKVLLEIWELNQQEIICPAYTCVVVPHAIIKSNNIPRFIDSSKDSFHMDYRKIEESINVNTGAIIVTHLFGDAMNVEEIDKIVKKAEKKYSKKIYVIQDVAHSYGVKFNGKLVTTFGDAALFGCNISKIINSIFGGMIITNDKRTHQKIKNYQKLKMNSSSWLKEIARLIYMIVSWVAFNKYFYYWVNYLDRKGYLNRFTKYYDEEKIDFPLDWNETPKKIEARVGRVQLRKYDDFIHKRRLQAKNIIEKLKNSSDIKIRDYDENSNYSHLVALVENPSILKDKYYSNGIELGTVIDYNVPEMSAYKQFNLNDYQNSNYYSTHIINFPLSSWDYLN